MRATHRRLTQLNVSIGRSLCPTERHARPVRAGRANESDLLAGVATSDDLESAGQELKRPVGRPPLAHREAFDRGAGDRIVRLRRHRCRRVRRSRPGIPVQWALRGRRVRRSLMRPGDPIANWG